MAHPGERTQRALNERNRRFSVRALIASNVGTAIDYYDVNLYNIVAAIYAGKLFFPGHDPFLSTLASFATLIPGYASKPFGAAFFGHYGDRIGRKAALIATLVTMGLASVGIGLVPPYSMIGVWAPVLLVILRIFQGIGGSGEWGGAVLLSVEWAQGARGRGWAGSWTQMGVPAGALLGYLAIFASTALLGRDSYWGWRVPFLASALLIFLGLYVRLGLLETPAFTRVLELRQQFSWPLATVLSSNWRRVILCSLLTTSPLAAGVLISSFILSYATVTLKIPQFEILGFVLLGSAVSMGTVLAWGRLSDRIGRQRMYVIGALTALAFAVPYWWLLDTREELLVLLAVVFSFAIRDMQYGPLAAYIAEVFPTHIRYTGAGLGFNLGSAALSGTTSLIALSLLHAFGSSTAIGVYLMGAAVLSLVAALLLRDHSQEAINDELDVGGPAVQ